MRLAIFRELLWAEMWRDGWGLWDAMQYILATGLLPPRTKGSNA